MAWREGIPAPTIADPVIVDNSHPLASERGRRSGRWSLSMDFEKKMASMLAVVLICAPALAPAEEEWHELGLLRMRDMTPFGLARLDFLPAHAVNAPPHTFAV